MGGWFNKEIKSVDDLGGLRMRIPGMGGQALEKLGVSVQVIPGGEIYQSLESGAIDGAEWVGPYDDLKQEFNKVTDFYYYPGWWEPGPSLDVYVPRRRVRQAAGGVPGGAAVGSRRVVHADAGQVRHAEPARARGRSRTAASRSLPFPDDVLRGVRTAPCRRSSTRTRRRTPGYKEVLDSYRAYQAGLDPWFGLAEKAMLDFLGRVAGTICTAGCIADCGAPRDPVEGSQDLDDNDEVAESHISSTSMTTITAPTPNRARPSESTPTTRRDSDRGARS